MRCILKSHVQLAVAKLHPKIQHTIFLLTTLFKDVQKNLQIIIQLFVTLIKVHNKTFTMNMLHLKSDLERITFALRWINSPPNTNPLVRRAEKDRFQAELMRKAGNRLYAKQKYEAALNFYTLSVSMAHVGSSELQLALGNRSATFFQLKMYEQCLADIELVFAKKCSITLLEKLLKRKKEALELLPTQIKTPYYVDLPTIPEEAQNPTIPSASNAIAIRQNPRFGRHIVAQRDIKVGEVLIVEKPIGQIVCKEKESHCSECMELCYNLIPCDHCSFVLYCNESCKQTAFERYHQFECPIGESLSELGDEIVLATRIAFTTRDEWNQANLNSYNWTASEAFQSDRYKELNGLESHEKGLPNLKLFDIAVIAASVFCLVQKGTNFFKNYDLRKFKRVILRLIGIMKYNNVNQHELAFDVEENRYTKDAFATCIYPVCALLNHSCAPNLTSYSCGNKVVVCSVANIRAGEQCFINYEIGFEGIPKSTRKLLLLASYCFFCTCVACRQNWPMREDLPRISTIPFCNDEITQLTMAGRDPKVMKAIKKKLIRYLQNFGDFWTPSYNVFIARRELAFCLNGLGNIKRPLQN